VAAKSIVMAGAGGNIGSHLVPHLARMAEVERVVLIDRDRYENRNRTNQDILPRDVGQPKVCVQARRLIEIRPGLEVEAIHAPLESVPLGTWRADLIVACLDSAVARQAVNQNAWRTGVPWADAGVLASESLARVNIYVPSVEAPCLECAWSEDNYGLLEQQYPCEEAMPVPAPTGASSALGALAAALLALECRKMLAGDLEHAAISRQFTLNARWHQSWITLLHRNSRCRFDHAIWTIERLLCHTGEMRLANLLEQGDVVSVPGFRFVNELVCRACGGRAVRFHLECSSSGGLQRCEACGGPMAAPGFDVVETLTRDLPTAVLSMSLEEVGLRYADVLRIDGRCLMITANRVIGGDK